MGTLFAQFAGLFWPLRYRFSTGKALLSLCTHDALPCHSQISQRKQHRQPRRALPQAPVAHLGVAKLLLFHPERLFHLVSHAGLKPLGLVFVWCLSGSRSPSLFLVELGAAMLLASTMGPVLSIRSCWAKPMLIGRQQVFLQQVAKVQDDGFVRHAGCAIKIRKAAAQRPLVQLFFHGRITHRFHHSCRQWMHSMVSIENQRSCRSHNARMGIMIQSPPPA